MIDVIDCGNGVWAVTLEDHTIHTDLDSVQSLYFMLGAVLQDYHYGEVSLDE